MMPLCDCSPVPLGAKKACRNNWRMRKLLVVMFLAACGEGPKTIADACLLLSKAACGRLSQCGGLTISIDECSANNTRACCAADDCSRPIKNYDLLYACEAGFKNQSCGDAIANLVPAACGG